MTIDASTAALLAQIFPVLLIFLALEDRLRPASIQSKNWRKWISRARELAVILSLVSLFMCLLIVVAKVEPGLMSWVVILSMVFVLATLFILFALKFGREAIEEAQESS